VYEYRSDFYRLLASFAVRSVERTVPKVAAALPIRSVVDFGCGHGAWLSVWAAMSVSVTGIDGSYVDERRLLIDAKDFHVVDLAAPIGLARQFDLVQSLAGCGKSRAIIGERPIAVDLAIEDEGVAGRPGAGRPPARSMIANQVWPNAMQSRGRQRRRRHPVPDAPAPELSGRAPLRLRGRVR
jgi:hypothetical protein